MLVEPIHLLRFLSTAIGYSLYPDGTRWHSKPRFSVTSCVFTQSSAPHTPLRETKSVPHTGEAGRRLIRGPRQDGWMLPILPYGHSLSRCPTLPSRGSLNPCGLALPLAPTLMQTLMKDHVFRQLSTFLSL